LAGCFTPTGPAAMVGGEAEGEKKSKGLASGVGFFLREAAANGTSFLGAQIKGLVFFVLVEHTQLLPLSLADDSVDTGNRLPDLFDFAEFGRGTTSYLLDAQISKLGLQLFKLFYELILFLCPQFVCFDLGHRR